MIDRKIYFEEKNVNPESNTTTLYFIAPTDLLTKGKYPEAESAEISIEFPTAYPEARYADVMISPTKDGEDYDWLNINIPLSEIEKLMVLAEMEDKTE